MVSATDQQVDVVAGDGEGGRGDRPGGQVVVQEGVHQSLSEVTVDGLLVADRSRHRAGVDEVAGGGPPGAPGRSLEVGEDRSGRWGAVEHGARDVGWLPPPTRKFR